MIFFNGHRKMNSSINNCGWITSILRLIYIERFEFLVLFSDLSVAFFHDTLCLSEILIMTSSVSINKTNTGKKLVKKIDDPVQY